MTKLTSYKEFPGHEYILYCIALVFCQTYFTYSSYDGFWISLFYNMAGLFSGLFSFLWAWMNYGDSYFNIFMILPVLPIFVVGARNFSPPYSTFIRFYFVSNIIGYILFALIDSRWDYNEFIYKYKWFAITIPILILHLNIILSKNPIVKGVDNLAIKLPSSSGSSSLGDDLD